MQHTHHLSVEPRTAGERGHVMSGGALQLTALTTGQEKARRDARGIVFKCLTRLKVRNVLKMPNVLVERSIFWNMYRMS